MSTRAARSVRGASLAPGMCWAKWDLNSPFTM